MKDTILNFELKRCQTVFDTKILGTDNVLALSAFIEIIIRLNYILQELSKAGKRVSFIGDVQNGDITDLVNKMRHAVCHSDSPLNKISEATLKYNLIGGYYPKAVKIGNITIGSKYKDDAAINFGSRIIYLKRHMGRLLKELPLVVSSLGN